MLGKLSADSATSASSIIEEILSEYAETGAASAVDIRARRKRITAWVDDDIWQAAKKRAKYDGFNLSEIIATGIYSKADANG